MRGPGVASGGEGSFLLRQRRESRPSCLPMKSMNAMTSSGIVPPHWATAAQCATGSGPPLSGSPTDPWTVVGPAPSAPGHGVPPRLGSWLLAAGSAYRTGS